MPPPDPGNTPFAFLGDDPALLARWDAALDSLFGHGSRTANIAEFQRQLGQLPADARTDFARGIFDWMRRSLWGGAAPEPDLQLGHLSGLAKAPWRALDPWNIYPVRGGPQGGLPAGSQHYEHTYGPSGRRLNNFQDQNREPPVLPPAEESKVPPGLPPKGSIGPPSALGRALRRVPQGLGAVAEALSIRQLAGDFELALPDPADPRPVGSVWTDSTGQDWRKVDPDTWRQGAQPDKGDLEDTWLDPTVPDGTIRTHNGAEWVRVGPATWVRSSSLEDYRRQHPLTGYPAPAPRYPQPPAGPPPVAESSIRFHFTRPPAPADPLPPLRRMRRVRALAPPGPVSGQALTSPSAPDPATAASQALQEQIRHLPGYLPPPPTGPAPPTVPPPPAPIPAWTPASPAFPGVSYQAGTAPAPATLPPTVPPAWAPPAWVPPSAAPPMPPPVTGPPGGYSPPPGPPNGPATPAAGVNWWVNAGESPGLGPPPMPPGQQPVIWGATLAPAPSQPPAPSAPPIPSPVPGLPGGYSPPPGPPNGAGAPAAGVNWWVDAGESPGLGPPPMPPGQQPVIWGATPAPAPSQPPAPSAPAAPPAPDPPPPPAPGPPAGP